MVHGVFDLIGRQPPVHGEKHRPHHGNGKKALQVSVGVVIEYGHRISPFDAESGKRASQSVDPFKQIAVGIAHLVPVNDFLIARGEF